MNKKLKSLFVIVVAITVLGCANLSAIAQQKMTVWHGYTQPARMKAMEQTVADFEKKHPGVEVKIEVTPWSRLPEKISTAIATGIFPDIMFTPVPNVIGLWNAGVLAPMDEIVQKLGGPEAYLVPMDALAKYEGHYVFTPHYQHSDMLLYRKDWLEEAGLAVPENWYGLLHATRVLNNPPDHYGFVQYWADYTASYTLDRLFKVNKAHYFDENLNLDFNTPNGRETVAFLVDLFREGSPPGATNYGDGDTFRIFDTGKTAFIFESGFTCSVFLDKHGLDKGPKMLGAAYIPRGRASRDECHYIAHMLSACRFKKADPKLSEDFLLTIYDPENYVRFLHAVPGAMVPALRSIYTSSAWRDHPRIKAMKSVLETQEAQFAKGTHPTMGLQLNPYSYLIPTGPIRKMLQRIVAMDVPLEEAVAQAEQELKEVIQEVK